MSPRKIPPGRDLASIRPDLAAQASSQLVPYPLETMNTSRKATFSAEFALFVGDAHADAGIQKFDGYKESWLRASFPVASIKHLRGALVDDEEWDLCKSA